MTMQTMMTIQMRSREGAQLVLYTAVFGRALTALTLILRRGNRFASKSINFLRKISNPSSSRTTAHSISMTIQLKRKHVAPDTFSGQCSRGTAAPLKSAESVSTEGRRQGYDLPKYC